MDLCDHESLSKIFKKIDFDSVCNLAAQAGVRYSLEQPREYINSNIIGFLIFSKHVKNLILKIYLMHPVHLCVA